MNRKWPPPLHRVLPRPPPPFPSFPSPTTRLLSSLLPLTTESPSDAHPTHADLLRRPALPPLRPPLLGSAFASGHTLSVAETQALHAHVAKTSAFHSSDPYFANCLANAYCKAGILDAALHLLDEIRLPNTISWNLTISVHNRRLHFRESLQSFCVMRQLGVEPTEVTYGSVLSACAISEDIKFGGQVHGLVVKNGFLSNRYVRTGLVDMFAKNCSLEDAVNVFLENLSDKVVVWNAVISGCVKNSENHLALNLFHQMISGFCMPNEFTLSSVLTACTGAGELELGRGIHGWVIKCGVNDDVVVGSALIDLYAKCGDNGDAVMQFSLMPVHNVVSWTTIISAFVQEDPKHALLFFKALFTTSTEINKYTVTSVLAACGNVEMVKEAVQLHCWVLKSGFSTDHVVRAALISMYLKSGESKMSEEVFEENRVANDVASWAAMISGLVQNENSEKGLQVFQTMFHGGTKPDKICCCSVLSSLTSINWVKQLHSYIIKSGLILSVPVTSALFTMYSKCDSLDDSYRLFKEMPGRDVVAWTSMIAGLTEHGHVQKAFRLFREMIFSKVMPDEMTLSYAITACADQHYLLGGKEIHGNALRAGLEDDMLITGYAQNGCTREALLAFHKMLISGFRIDYFSCSSVIGVCADITGPILGKQLHAFVTKAGMLHDLSVSSALITMYSKCGSINYARKLFDQIEKPDLITWTAIIDGYSQNGEGEEALKIYSMMLERGTKPDSLALASVLSACSHNGLIEDGFMHFSSMTEGHGIEPEIPHYACMVDLLGRSGRLKEAANFIQHMPVKPTALIWSTLLGACKVHGDVELGRLAAQKSLELEPNDSGTYISLSNMSADLGDWKQALKIRHSMRQVGVKKEPGWSFVG